MIFSRYHSWSHFRSQMFKSNADAESIYLSIYLFPFSITNSHQMQAVNLSAYLSNICSSDVFLPFSQFHFPTLTRSSFLTHIFSTYFLDPRIDLSIYPESIYLPTYFIYQIVHWIWVSFFSIYRVPFSNVNLQTPSNTHIRVDTESIYPSIHPSVRPSIHLSDSIYKTTPYFFLENLALFFVQVYCTTLQKSTKY